MFTAIKLRKMLILGIILFLKIKYYATSFKKIIVELQNFLKVAAQNPEKYRQKKSDFTRNRKLFFSILCMFLSKLLKKVYRQNSMIYLSMGLLVLSLRSARQEKN